MNSKYDTWWGFSHIYLMFIFFLLPPEYWGCFALVGFLKSYGSCLSYLLVCMAIYGLMMLMILWLVFTFGYDYRIGRGMVWDGVNKVNNRQRVRLLGVSIQAIFSYRVLWHSCLATKNLTQIIEYHSSRSDLRHSEFPGPNITDISLLK